MGTQVALRQAPGPAPAPSVPIAGLWRLAALGDAPLAASVLWMRTASAWANHSVQGPPVEHAVRACLELDPTWSVPIRYGALMLAADGQLDAHEATLRLGAEHFPDDPWFPSALAASRYLSRGDLPGAVLWLEHAADSAGDDSFYELAAERLRERLP